MHSNDRRLDGLWRDLLHILLEPGGDLVGLLIGHETHADLSHRDRRDHRLRPLAGEPGQQAVDLEGRARPHALQGAVTALAEEARRTELLGVPLLVEWQPLPLRALLFPERPHIVVEAGDLDASATILHLREDVGEHEGWIRDRPPERPGMQVRLRASEVDLKVDEAAQAVADRRHPAIEHRRIRDDDDIRLELVLVLFDEGVEVRRADLFLAFENDLDVHGKPAVLLQVRFDGLEVHEHLALVVGGAARVDLAVAHRRLERRRLPEIERIDRLYIVMPVEEDGRRTLGAEPVSVHNGEAWCLDQPNVLETDASHFVGGPLGATLDVAAMLRQCADARYRQILLELVDVPVAIGVDEVDDGRHR